jgi:hypothetical protein
LLLVSVVMMMMMVMMVMMMMMICLCFFAAVCFAGFALVFCFSSGAALGVEGVWPLLTHVILAAALESFWLKRFGSSFLAVDRELVYIKKKTLESGILAQAHGNHSCQGPGPAPNGAAKRAAHSRRWGSRACGGRGRTPQPLWPPAWNQPPGLCHRRSCNGRRGRGAQLPAAGIYEDSHFGSCPAVFARHN